MAKLRDARDAELRAQLEVRTVSSNVLVNPLHQPSIDETRCPAVTMRLLKSLLAASLLVAGSLAAKKSSADRFNDFHAKALKTSPIQLSEVTYNSITKSPRDYSVAVLLTALGTRFGCQLCRDFQPEWELLGRSWTRGDKKGESRLLFATLDFADGRDVFMSVRDTLLRSSVRAMR